MQDDRMFPTNYRALVDKMTPHVARLKKLHETKSPKHWTIQDVRTEAIEGIKKIVEEQQRDNGYPFAP